MTPLSCRAGRASISLAGAPPHENLYHELVWRDLARQLIRPGPPEWAALRRELARARAARGVSATERALARELAVLREQAVRAFGALEACAVCARGRPLPNGRFEGGFCCGAPTEELFTEEEVAILALGGTTARDLRPRPALAGCLFRGPTGCVLAPRHRPVVCIAHICRDLEHELALRGDLEALEARCAELRRRFDALVERRRKRLDARWLEELR